MLIKGILRETNNVAFVAHYWRHEPKSSVRANSAPSLKCQNRVGDCSSAAFGDAVECLQSQNKRLSTFLPVPLSNEGCIQLLS